ncbi:unnamed protein product [Gongylonema pulchrum]|uniref:Uncharacterized protein n=1 Tax=Gongylonema pulchrum TaxID=637853 RepID=A0A183E4M8_9BILA|nr:unnamed protein product [Gongylonema pulchrum]
MPFCVSCRAAVFLLSCCIYLAYCCGPNILSYNTARLQAKMNYDQAVEVKEMQRRKKMQAVFDNAGSELASAKDEIRLHPAEKRNDRPKCQQCEILDPSTALSECPVLIKELQCQPYVVEYRGEDCLLANITCPQPTLPNEDVAVYLGVVGLDLSNRNRAVHIMQYAHDDKGNFDIDKAHHGHGYKAHLNCNDYRKWIVSANDRKYAIDLLFCLPLRTDQLDLVRNLFPVY